MIAVEVRAHPDQFDCNRCAHRNCDSDHPAPFARWVIPGVIESRTCLLPMITPLTRQLLRYERHYRNGFLPWPGGMMQQPNKFLMALDHLETVKTNGQ